MKTVPKKPDDLLALTKQFSIGPCEKGLGLNRGRKHMVFEHSCHCCLQRNLVRRFQASEARECLLNRSLARLEALPGGVDGLQ